ncbi:hypothetical protein [Streptomyces sp. NBRC 110028]|uniref:hypothetical protein n=1 Tax=Streptomyces sp. NBRC 110028 TaxID=1621260 RepID=UPI0006E30E87|nr:hypothetical protein [Streptomyces sp. NBRC 110028]
MRHCPNIIGDQSGAVIQDRCNTFYWLTAPGGAASWNLRRVHVLGETKGVTTYLGVPRTGHPAPGRTGGSRSPAT